MIKTINDKNNHREEDKEIDVGIYAKIMRQR